MDIIQCAICGRPVYLCPVTPYRISNYHRDALYASKIHKIGLLRLNYSFIAYRFHPAYWAPTRYPLTVSTPLHFKCTWYRTVNTGHFASLPPDDTSSNVALFRISAKKKGRLKEIRQQKTRPFTPSGSLWVSS